MSFVQLANRDEVRERKREIYMTASLNRLQKYQV